MWNKLGGYRALLLSFTALCLTAAMMGAKAQGNGGMKIASIDQGKLFDEYKYTQEASKALQKKGDDAQLMLQTWAQNALLTEGDQKRLSDLAIENKAAGEGKLDAGKKSEMDKLTKQSNEYNNDFVALQGVQQPNPTQQMRLGVLTRAYSDTQARIDAQRKAISAEIEKQRNDNRDQIFKDMRASIAQVAKAKGFNLVVTTEVAFYCDSDITDAVLANMNGKK